jgi:hypothetical protein
VIPEIDIWRTAQLMLKRYGDKTIEESAARADELVATTTGRPCGAGSLPRSLSSRTRHLPDHGTDLVRGSVERLRFGPRAVPRWRVAVRPEDVRMAVTGLRGRDTLG